MNEAITSDTRSYLTFNDFFSRRLRDDVRPVNTDPNVLIMPSDGMISQFGRIKKNRLFLVKGAISSLEELLNHNSSMSKTFYNGIFVMIYLSPKDCHRVYMPCNAILREMIHVPGELFSVNQSMVSKSKVNVFTCNERVICLFDTVFGPMLQILVGAIIVGSIETVWSGMITPPHRKIITHMTWPNTNHINSISLLKGQEMGCFKLGSTVINLFVSDKVKLVKTLKSQLVIKKGQPMAIGIKSVF